MIVRAGESQRLASSSGTIAGINIFAYLVASANGPGTILPANFLPQLFNCKTVLTRRGVQYTIHNDNLLNLGTFYTRKNAYERFYRGLNINPGASGVKQINQRIVTILFESPITVNQGDQLEMQMSLQAGAFAANIDPSQSYIDFLPMPSTGVEIGIPMFNSQVIQSNATQQPFNLGDNVKRIQFINYDQPDFANLVLSNISLSSDKLQYSATFFEQLASDQSKYPQNKPYRYGTTAIAEDIVMDIDWLPQSVDIFHADGKALNQVNVNLTFNSANVNASQNWVMGESVFIDPAYAKIAIQRIANNAKKSMMAIQNGTGS